MMFFHHCYVHLTSSARDVGEPFGPEVGENDGTVTKIDTGPVVLTATS